ncbi:unnamed protein product [Victoria cruziana]
MARILSMNGAFRLPVAGNRSMATRRLASMSSVAVPGKKQMRIQKLIEEERIVLMPSCYDALSASLLGKPDFGLLMPPEMAEKAQFICTTASKIPIIADADTSGGNALNVQRTIQDLFAAGAAGCFLEDQAWPKKCGHMRGK